MKRLWIWTKDVFWLIVAVALVGAGVYGFRYLGEIRPVVVAQSVERPIVLVDTTIPQAFAAPVPIRGEGFIQPFREVALAAETSGRVVEMHPSLEARGRFSEGEILIRLDDATARASLEQTDANIASTEARLDLVETQLKRAETLRARGVISQDQLDQLESQQTELTASLTALRAGRRTAEIALERTAIRAPFDGAVLNSTVELGTIASSGLALATLYSVDELEVTVPVRQAEAALIPGLFEGAGGSATVKADFAGRTYQWNASIARVDNALDKRTRTLDVTLRLEDMMGQQVSGTPTASGAPPALINSFARVVIDGVQDESLYAIPSTAYRAGDTVWLYVDGTLVVTRAERVHVDGEESFVRIGELPDGAEIVTSSLDTAFAGMKVRKADDEVRHAEASE
jgi:RND family efflux transporter MFP subunit